MKQMLALLALLLQSQDPLDRLVGELKSPSKERQAMAKVALRAYGGAAVDRLKKAGIDLGFTGGEEPTEENQNVAAKVKSIRVTIDMQNASLSAIVEYLHDITGLEIRIDTLAIPNADQQTISFKVADIVLDGALRLMLGPRGHRYVIRGGVVVLTGAGEPEELPSRWPVRLLADSPDARRHVAGLSGETPEEREKAIEGLRRLGFGAEPALWEALDSKDAETLGRARELLRELYVSHPRPQTSPAEARLRSKTVTVTFEKEPPAKVLGSLSEAAGVLVAVDARKRLPEWTITLRGKDIPVEHLITLLARQMQREFVFMGDWILVTHDGSRILETRPYGPVWGLEGEIRRIEASIGSLASGDPDRRKGALEELLAEGPGVLGPLLQASRILPPAAAARCREARERYVDSKGYWLADEPSGAALQALSLEQRALLEKPVDIAVVDATLEEALKSLGVAATVKAPFDRRMNLWARGLKTGTALRSLTGPYGLDFHLDGTTVVIDTAGKVRAAVSK